MTSALRLSLLASAAIVLVFAGCDIETVNPPAPNDRPAGTVVINEVFTLPTTEPTRFNWIEFLNAGSQAVNLHGYTLEFTTYRLRSNVDVAIFPNGDFVVIQVYPAFVAGYGRYRVPVTAFNPPSQPGDPSASVPLPPGGLMTMVDNESRMRDFTDWGPGSSNLRYETQLLYSAVDDTVDTLLYVPDSVTVVRGGFNSYGFLLATTDELVLRDTTGAVIDVVRYGNYVAPSPDPYPGNQSMGMIPPFESIYRYAGGFKTNNPWGNTAYDFAVSDQYVRPIPQWYSQPHRR